MGKLGGIRTRCTLFRGRTKGCIVNKSAGAAFVLLGLSFAGPAEIAQTSPAATHTAWIATIILLLAFVAAAGVAVGRGPFGTIIDNRNRMSLSKVQMILWTIMILSALVVATFFRVAHSVSDAADIDVQGELLVLMGISLTSTAITPLILRAKQDQSSDKPGFANASHKDVSAASLIDLIRGDDMANAGAIDLSKVQQLIITLGVMVSYSASIWTALSLGKGGGATWFSTFPALKDGLVGLIGISHAGYLAYKAAPHGKGDKSGEAAGFVSAKQP